MSEGVVFCDPPGRPDRGRLHDLLLPLIERPGEWALLPGHYTKGIAGQLQTRGHGGYRVPAGTWKFTMRSMPGLPSGRVSVWAKYLGPEEAA